jgi:hypothetical protein
LQFIMPLKLINNKNLPINKQKYFLSTAERLKHGLGLV